MESLTYPIPHILQQPLSVLTLCIQQLLRSEVQLAHTVLLQKTLFWIIATATLSDSLDCRLQYASHARWFHPKFGSFPPLLLHDSSLSVGTFLESKCSNCQGVLLTYICPTQENYLVIHGWNVWERATHSHLSLLSMLPGANRWHRQNHSGNSESHFTDLIFMTHWICHIPRGHGGFLDLIFLL